MEMENQINVGDQNTQQIGQNPVSQPVQIPEKPKVNYWMISSIILFVLLLGWGSYYMLKVKNQPELQPPIVKPPSTGTPYQQPTTMPSIDTGEWKLKTIDKSNLDNFLDLYITNSQTGEERYLGRIGPYVAEREAILINNQQEVIFIQTTAGKPEDPYNPLDDKLVVYSIPEKTAVKQLTLKEIKNALPTLQIPRNAVLNYLAISPNNKVAMSYGYILETDWGSDIIVFDIATGKVSTLTEKGIVKDWRDETTIRYDTIDTSVPVSGEQYPPRITKEAKVSL